MKKLDKEHRSRNIQRWAMYCPEGAHKLLDFECQNVHFYQTEKGELNLSKGEFNFHSNEAPVEEAQKWFESLELYNISTLVVYGVGLGYYYEPIKEWLEKNSNHFLIILEDDLEVISRLLETDAGTKLIFDDRVWLQYLNKEDKDFGISDLPHYLFLGDIKVSTLDSYRWEKGAFFQSIANYMHYLKNIKMWSLMEHVGLGRGFFQNFYRNIIDLPKSHLSDKLFDQFKGKPAIICGAGPSLEKNRETLEKLKDHALIFAGGSAMNVLSSTGFVPHFGAGIDPNAAQHSRLSMNQAYEVPYFYRMRMQTEAVRSIHGEHLFVRGSSGYEISSWLEEKFGMKGETISEGNNVVNFSLAIANALGCNPIIFVGLDLAYTERKSYSKGVLGHPLYDFDQDIATKGLSEELLEKEGVDGKPVYTLWKWIMESNWFSGYARKHPELQLINATEGGLGIDGVPNMTLKEVAKKFLQQPFDFDAHVHGVIQNSPMPKELNEPGVLEAIGEINSSLKRSEEYCTLLQNKYISMLEIVESGGDLPIDLITDKTSEYFEKLSQEIAYTYILKTFGESFSLFKGKNLQNYDQNKIHEDDRKEKIIKSLNQNRSRYEFLRSVCISNQHEIANVLHEHASRKMVAEALEKSGKMGMTPTPSENQKGETYAIDGSDFVIIDDELGINIQIELGDRVETRYNEKTLESRCYMLEGKLHGPSEYYSPKGTLLAKSWFVHGKKEGKVRYYYSTGELYSRQRFKAGVWEGRQEYYFPSGQLKASIQYKNGKLEGDVVLFHEDGIRYRQLAFKDGMREGKEYLWNMSGVLELQVEYQQDRPLGACRGWYPNGKLGREVIYDNDSKVCSVRQWSPEGVLLPEASLMREDYFDVITKQTGILTDSLNQIYSSITSKSSSLSPEMKSAFGEEMDSLKGEMEKLERIEEQMLHELESKEGGDEKIWKTPSARRMMGKQLEDATKKMIGDISLIEEALKLTRKKEDEK